MFDNEEYDSEYFLSLGLLIGVMIVSLVLAFFLLFYFTDDRKETVITIQEIKENENGREIKKD